MKRGKPANESKKLHAFTPTEVGTLLESMDKKIDLIAENHGGLDGRLEKVEIALHGNSRRLDTLEVGFRVVNDRVTGLEDGLSKLSKDVGGIFKELKGTREELGAKIDDLGNRLSAVEAHR